MPAKKDQSVLKRNLVNIFTSLALLYDPPCLKFNVTDIETAAVLPFIAREFSEEAEKVSAYKPSRAKRGKGRKT